MRIAVIADTHDRYPAGLPARLTSADEIWHLGDVCDPSVLGAFQSLGKPMQVVLGNNEAHELWPRSLTLERAGRRLLLTHIPPRSVPRGVEIVLHGHTHVPRDEIDANGVRWLNPGCISRPNRGAPASFGWLEVQPHRHLSWTIVPL